FFPPPNTTSPNYNFIFQESNRVPKHNEVARMDYNLDAHTTLYGVLNLWSEEEKGNNVPAGSTKWGWLPATYAPKSKTVNLAANHFFSPTLILETSVAASRWTETAHPMPQDLAARDRILQGDAFPQFHPENNPLHLLPAASFGGINNPPNVTYDGRFPIRGAENTFTGTVNVTKIHGVHTAKAGVFLDPCPPPKRQNPNLP